MRPKLLVVGEAGRNSGFEKVVRGVCTPLHEGGAYDVVVRGLGYDPRYPLRRYPYTVKPTGSTEEDVLGARHFNTWLAEDRPDALLVVHDCWNILTYMARKPLALPTVAYFPVDAPCIKPSYALAFGAVSEAVAYTKFGAREAAIGVRGAVDELQRVLEPVHGWEQPISGFRTPQRDTELRGRLDRMCRYQNPEHFNVVPHGKELGLFGPRNQARARSLFGIPADAFVVLNVATNSPRKRLDLTIKAFAKVAAMRSDAYLVLHCSEESIPFNGWDLSAAAQYYGVPRDRFVLSQQLYPNASDDEMCWLYNAASVQVNTSGGEGYSLTAQNGAQCGVPQLVPDWSATRELWAGYGELIPVASTHMQPRFFNAVHCAVDVDWLANRLLELADSPEQRGALVERALAFTANQLPWAEVSAAFDSIIQNALNEPEARGVTLRELEEARLGTLVSEGAL